MTLDHRQGHMWGEDRSSSISSASRYSFDSQNGLNKGELVFLSQIVSQLMVRTIWFCFLTFSKCEDLKPSSSDHSYIFRFELHLKLHSITVAVIQLRHI